MNADRKSVQPQNTVFILSDEHNRNIAGCYGHPFIRTPNIDTLAARGTQFTNAYCNSPICVPSRAALATGRYVHRTRCWDNAMPYHGQIPSWHHVIRDAGHEVVSIGKLHFRSSDDDNGFSREILPMHILDGKGDLKGLLRRNPPPKVGADDMARSAGVGVSDYFAFDRKVAQASADWIADAASRSPARPWVLFVSFVMPHFPLIAPEAYYSLYEDYDLDDLRVGLNAPVSSNPVMAEMRARFDYDTHFDDDRRAVALRAYFGMVTALDDLVGQIVSAVAESSSAAKTRIIYTSDHGDNLGNRGL
ncbi:MAG: sulfatase-like hydrolase/transferase, partial [Alphaproteobacteria bacterium]